MRKDDPSLAMGSIMQFLISIDWHWALIEGVQLLMKNVLHCLQPVYVPDDVFMGFSRKFTAPDVHYGFE